jgi:para-nitrobenzyl esterase
MISNSTLTVDLMFRSGALRVASAKAAAGDKVWNYLFAWKSPVLGGAWAAGHSMEIAFVFDNVAAGRQSTGAGSGVARLSAEMSKAWVNFARTGNPNGQGVTAWANYTAQQPATMLFDTPSSVRTGFDADLLSLSMPHHS